MEIGERKRVAPLSNVIRFDTLYRDLQRYKDNAYRIGVFSGRSGLGKTQAAMNAVTEYDAYHVQVGYSWNKKFFCKASMVEMGLLLPDERVKLSIPEMIAHIAQQLLLSQRTLIIDDAQFLVQKGIIELARDIAEQSHAPVILIGEEGLPRALKDWDRVDNRVRVKATAEPCDLGDTATLARHVCGDIEIANDVLAALCAEVKGNASRIVINLEHIRAYALANTLTGIDLATYKSLVAER